MHTKELPESEILVRSADINEIAEALRKALEGSLGAGYSYKAQISGKSSSGLVLATQPYMETTRLPKMLLPTEMAKWLMDIEKWQSRYNPPVNKDRMRGWEIRRALTDEGPIAIVWTAWIVAPAPAMPIFM